MVGYDAGKRVKGRKRHLLTDTLGTDFHKPDEARFQALMDGGRCGSSPSEQWPWQESSLPVTVRLLLLVPTP